MKKMIFAALILFVGSFLVGTASADLNDGLVAYYPFNGNANDESGHGNNGTVYGATLTSDMFGNLNSAYLFDGIDDYINVGNSADFNFVAGVTFAAWINPSKLPYNQSPIIDKWVNSMEDKHLYFLPNAKVRFYLFNCFNGENMDSNNTIPLNQWTFVTATYYGTTAKIYLNGVLDSRKSVNRRCIENLTSNMYFGFNPERAWTQEAVPFSGIIDEVRIYNRTLSESEIQELYNVNECEATYDQTTKRLYIPCVAVKGTGDKYEFELAAPYHVISIKPK